MSSGGRIVQNCKHQNKGREGGWESFVDEGRFQLLVGLLALCLLCVLGSVAPQRHPPNASKESLEAIVLRGIPQAAISPMRYLDAYTASTSIVLSSCREFAYGTFARISARNSARNSARIPDFRNREVAPIGTVAIDTLGLL